MFSKYNFYRAFVSALTAFFFVFINSLAKNWVLTKKQTLTTDSVASTGRNGKLTYLMYFH
jgi:hypothetical protein